jgi:hypothetical protein
VNTSAGVDPPGFFAGIDKIRAPVWGCFPVTPEKIEKKSKLPK